MKKYFKFDERDFVLAFLLCFIILMLFFGAMGQINDWFNIPDDNPYEELAEEVIESTTGLELDLTPNDDL